MNIRKVRLNNEIVTIDADNGNILKTREARYLKKENIQNQPMKKEILCKKCGNSIFKITISKTLDLTNGSIMVECLDCGDISHLEVTNEYRERYS